MNSSRRQFIGAAAATALAGTAKAQADRRPNVLYVFSDQHRACSMPGQAYNDAESPVLQALAAESVSFSNCISNYPVCSPYRGVLMTGRWPQETGIIDNAFPLKEDETTIGEVFERGGYRTGYVGKWHLDARGTEGQALKPAGVARHGFSDWMAWYNTNPHFDRSYTFDRVTGDKLTPAGYNASRMADDAVGFIERNRDAPWMLMVSWNPPHPPFRDAPPELVKKYDARSLQLRPNTGEQVERVVAGPATPVRENLAGYNAHIEAIDAEMGRLLKTLEETGQTDNTIVIYTSDHGEMMGAHGRMGKRLPHEESCNVPLLVRDPRNGGGGTQSDVLLSTIDIYPTLYGLAGMPVPEHCRGRDLSGAIRGETVESPETALLMHVAKDHASGRRNHPAPIFRGVRTKRYTYAVGEIGRWCLYDNQEDPYQQHNLADDAARASLMSELDGEVIRYLQEAGDRYPFHTQRA
ncbi:MAG: sulfatase [Acidobacteria bacterium]|nr:sulfatase [Acidobacteriota bacterium]